jgi:Uma2 family endonuclease
MSTAPMATSFEPTPVEGMQLTPEEFERIALADPDRPWELHRGRLVEKPAMSFRHNDFMYLVGLFIGRHLDLSRYRVRVNAGHVRHPATSYYIPDVSVIPLDQAASFIDRDDVLETYPGPLPFVVEVWSRSTARVDLNKKLPDYMARGDREIWYFHPFQRSIRAWRRREDGGYEEIELAGGLVELHALPGVRIDLDQLFALA